MFDHVSTPKELFVHKLGAALTMERTVLGMLEDLTEAAQSDELKQQFQHHKQETEGQIRNLEQCFHALGEDVDDSPCPAIQGLEKEGKATIKMTDESLLDAVVLSAAGETEHHEIAVYEGLIEHAEAMGATDVAALLRENLEQEEHTLREVQHATGKVAQRTAQMTA
jgi:ferritin-like metal-binding protein YciE